jgi:hypothetical protein
LRDLEREDPRGEPEIGSRRDAARSRDQLRGEEDRGSRAGRENDAARDAGDAPEGQGKPARPAGRRERDDDDRSR